MPQITVTLPPETSAVLARLEAFDLQAIATATAAAVAPDFWAQLVQYSQEVVGSGPSRFSAGWAAEPNGPGLAISNSSPVAGFIEYATRPHKIMPGNKPFLAWPVGRGAFSSYQPAVKAKANATWVYSWHGVNHPGTKGKHLFPEFMENVGGLIITNALQIQLADYLGTANG
jgi:hypothetical protein